MACLDKCKDLDVGLQAGLTAKPAPRTSLARWGSFRQQLPYLRYCCEQPNYCLLLTQAQFTLLSHSFAATLLIWLLFRWDVISCLQLYNTNKSKETTML